MKPPAQFVRAMFPHYADPNDAAGMTALGAATVAVLERDREIVEALRRALARPSTVEIVQAVDAVCQVLTRTTLAKGKVDP